MYDGFLTPDGMVPPSILNNGSRAQDDDTFINTQNTATMYMWRLLNMAITVFKWENLPKGIDERMLEFWLLRDGFIGFFKEEALKSDAKNRAPEGYAVLPLMLSGEWDIYNYPRDRRAYAVNGLNYELNDENSVIIFNDYLRVPMWLTIWQYVWRLAEVQRSIDINVMQQRTARVIRCDERQRLSYLNAAKEVDEGRLWIHGDKNLDLNDFQVFDVTTPYVGDELCEYKGKLWNEVLTYIGIENINVEKKERLIATEVESEQSDVEIQRFTRLVSRKQACSQINDLFGLNVTVDFRDNVETSIKRLEPQTSNGVNQDGTPSTGRYRYRGEGDKEMKGL